MPRKPRLPVFVRLQKKQDTAAKKKTPERRLAGQLGPTRTGASTLSSPELGLYKDRRTAARLVTQQAKRPWSMPARHRPDRLPGKGPLVEPAHHLGENDAQSHHDQVQVHQRLYGCAEY